MIDGGHFEEFDGAYHKQVVEAIKCRSEMYIGGIKMFFFVQSFCVFFVRSGMSGTNLVYT